MRPSSGLSADGPLNLLNAVRVAADPLSRGRGVLVNGWKDKGEKVVKPDDWNQYEITAKGNHIQLKLNGLVTVELDDDKSRDGIIALQLHAGPPMRVEFRSIKLKKL